MKVKIEPIRSIVGRLHGLGGRCFAVGGIVRDLFLQDQFYLLLSKLDLDIEVHGLQLDRLQEELEKFSKTLLVGKQFGVLRMHHYNIDWSLPRTDSVGRRPKVSLQPNLTIKEALLRRDITINAMAIDITDLCQNYEKILESSSKISVFEMADKGFIKLYDPFGGLVDLQARRINAVSAEKFIEDPLRFFRVMQIVARFEFSTSEKMNSLASKMILERSDKRSLGWIAGERISAEIEKMLLKSRKPSLGFSWIKNVGRLAELFPELFKIETEGQWSRFCESLNKCALLCGEAGAEDARLMFLLACIAYFISDVKSRKTFFAGLSFNNTMVCQVLKLAQKATIILASQQSLELKLLAKNLQDISLEQFFLFQQALGLVGQQECYELLAASKQVGVLHSFIPPLVTGKDLLEIIPPGPEMKELLAAAYCLQMKHSEYTKQDLIRLIIL